MFGHALDMKSGPLPPGGWDDNHQDSVGGEGDREVLLGDVGPGDFPKAKRSYRAELSSILLLLFLYVLQGIPLGLAGSIPSFCRAKMLAIQIKLSSVLSSGHSVLSCSGLPWLMPSTLRTSVVASPGLSLLSIY